MKKYVVILKDKQGELTKDLEYRHVVHLTKAAKEERLFLCGPLLGHGGAMQIVLAHTIEEAKDMINADPFVSEGFYTNYEIYELLEASLENNFLYKE